MALITSENNRQSDLLLEHAGKILRKEDAALEEKIAELKMLIGGTREDVLRNLLMVRIPLPGGDRKNRVSPFAPEDTDTDWIES